MLQKVPAKPTVALAVRTDHVPKDSGKQRSPTSKMGLKRSPKSISQAKGTPSSQAPYDFNVRDASIDTVDGNTSQISKLLDSFHDYEAYREKKEEEIVKTRAAEESNRIKMRAARVSEEEKQDLIKQALSLEMNSSKYARMAVKEERERLANRTEMRHERKVNRAKRREAREKILRAPLDDAAIEQFLKDHISSSTTSTSSGDSTSNVGTVNTVGDDDEERETSQQGGGGSAQQHGGNYNPQYPHPGGSAHAEY